MAGNTTTTAVSAIISVVIIIACLISAIISALLYTSCKKYGYSYGGISSFIIELMIGVFTAICASASVMSISVDHIFKL